MNRCACGHSQGHHGPRPLYHGSKEQQMDHSCYFCRCQGYTPGDPDGGNPFLQDPQHSEWRRAHGLPEMYCLGGHN
jgi:hypothetical protein